jgi:hypothetical protein
VVLAGLVIGLAPTAASATAPALVRPSSLAPGGPPAGAVAEGPLSSDSTMPLAVVLPPSNVAQLQSLLGSLYDPSSPEFHHWLGPGQFLARFGPSASDRSAVQSWLAGKGLSVTAMTGFALEISAPEHLIASALGTSFERYRSRTGRNGYVASATPLVPASLADGSIAAILGLNTTTALTAQQPDRVRAAAGGRAPVSGQADGLSACPAAESVAQSGFYTLDALGASYGLSALLSNAQNGHGQTIGVFELGPNSAADVSAYEACFGLTAAVTTVNVDGGAAASAGGTTEADADIEQLATQSPGASLISYEGPDVSPGPYDIWNAIVSSDAAQVVSTSWGECEPAAAADGSIPALTTLFQQAASQGQTILAASGDSGSEDCFRNLGSTTEQVDYPASDAWVTAVGGTDRFGPGDETVWNDCLSNESVACANSFGGQAAGGGGMSRYESRPAGQPGILTWPVAEPCGQSCREVPDISANAGVGMVAYAQGSWGAYGGTSLAAPFIAGLVADRNDGCTTSAGLWAPALYATAAQGGYGTAFNDITSGNNDMTGSNGGAYPALSGYDAAAGLGSPIPAGLSCPEVASVTPGYAGARVTVNGLGLEQASITFGGRRAPVISASATQATVLVPAGSGTVAVAASSPLGVGVNTAAFSYGTPPLPPAACPTGGPIHGALGTPWVMSAMADARGCPGYWVATRQGRIATFGAAPFLGDLSGVALNAPIVGMAATPDHGGYWLLGADGGIFSFGDASFYGSTGGVHLNQPVVAMASTPDGRGYWLVAADGGIFSFGDAGFHGSTGDLRLNKPVVGMASTPSGQGYWLVASDGGIFSFGNAPFLGSMGGVALNQPVVGITADPAGRGYRMVAADGGIFSFGAPFYGSRGGSVLPAPITTMAPSVDGNGYYLIDQHGDVYAFGDAPYDGSL